MNRYDLQSTIVSVGRFRAEEVMVFTNRGRTPHQLVALPLRESMLQVNWRAVSQEDENLVLLPRQEIEAMYEDEFRPLVAWLRRQKGLPKVIQQKLRGADWPHRLLHEDWREADSRVETLTRDFETWVNGVASQLRLATSGRDRALYLFIDYVYLKIGGTYRPWVQLNRPLKGADPGHHRYDRALVKYRADQRIDLKRWERVLNAVFGRVRLDIPFPVQSASSTHVRVRLPRGSVFQGPVQAPPRPWKTEGDTTEFQSYLGFRHSFNEDGLETRTHILPSMPVRFIALLIGLVVALIPVLLSMHDVVVPPAAGASPAEAAPTWNITALRYVDPGYLSAVAGAGLPLALALLGFAWDQAQLRPYALTQLGLGLVALLLWFVGTAVPYWGIGALALGGFLAVCNFALLVPTFRSANFGQNP